MSRLGSWECEIHQIQFWGQQITNTSLEARKSVILWSEMDRWLLYLIIMVLF
jgi:hypothetical protein